MTPVQALKRFQKASKGYRNRALVRLQDVNLATLQKRTKYGNRKVVKNGEKFDSVREYERHVVLLDMEKRGEISDLKRQVRYRLVVNDHHICDYIVDWTYRWTKKSRSALNYATFVETILVGEDAKGVKTADFIIKFKLAKALYPEIDWKLS